MEINEIKTGFWVNENVYVCPNSYELDIYPPNKGRTDKFTFTANGNEIGYFDVEADTYEEIKAKAEEFIAKWDAAKQRQIIERASLESEFWRHRMPKPEDYIPMLEKFKEATKIEVQNLLTHNIPKIIEHSDKELREVIEGIFNTLDERLKKIESEQINQDLKQCCEDAVQVQ